MAKEIRLSKAKANYYKMLVQLSEFGMVGAGIGSGFVDTNELHGNVRQGCFEMAKGCQ